MDLLMHRDTRTGKFDLVFVNGECPTTGDFVDVVTQRLYIRLRTLFQEWFLNVEYGVPYRERILGHRVRKKTVDIILQEQIMEESGVKQILSFQSSLNVGTRVYECSFRVRVEGGGVSPLISISSL